MSARKSANELRTLTLGYVSPVLCAGLLLCVGVRAHIKRLNICKVDTNYLAVSTHRFFGHRMLRQVDAL